MGWWEDFKGEFMDAFIDIIDPGFFGYLAGLVVFIAVMMSPFLLVGYLTGWR